jgi:hypothetical protein
MTRTASERLAYELAKTMHESELQSNAIDAAHALGYHVAHFRPARTAHGWATAVAADGKGWPDLCMAGRGRVMFRELKSEKGTLTKEQRVWGLRLGDAGADYRVWRPSDWLNGTIERELTT